MNRTVLPLARAHPFAGSSGTSSDWRRKALCLGHDPQMWYPVDSGGVEAAQICTECPVRLDCLAWALEHNESDGIWGGVSARRRRQMRAEAKRNVTR
jgi:WhiB family redox-sensing transcriptional regulator